MEEPKYHLSGVLHAGRESSEDFDGPEGSLAHFFHKKQVCACCCSSHFTDGDTNSERPSSHFGWFCWCAKGQDWDSDL